MIVCLCKNLNETTLKNELKDKTIKEFIKEFRKDNNRCNLCIPMIVKLYKETKSTT